MELLVYQTKYEGYEALEEFVDNFYSNNLPYLASDLLEKGIAPQDIVKSVQTAIQSCRVAGMPARQHFKPVYTQYKDYLVKDCKLSRFGYGLVLLNAPVKSPIVARWQVKLLEQFLR